MSGDYTSVLVTLRKDRTDVYIDGLPLVEFVNNKEYTITTKRRDLTEILSVLSDAIASLEISEDAIRDKQDVEEGDAL